MRRRIVLRGWRLWRLRLMTRRDRFGLGWRPQLAIGIHRCLERIDVLEVIADDWFDAPRQRLATLAAWCREVPVHLHGVSLGLASTVAVEDRRLARMARLVEAVRPERWSEHLAFVRGGGIELGHLAAPPRTAASIAGAALNLARATAAVGSAPLIENVATLIDPPGSTMDEPGWIRGILAATSGDLLLDLHNLHANAVNFAGDAAEAIRTLPAERIAAVHLSGGRWVGRLLDDHLHDPPEAVFSLLELVAERTPRPLDVIIERDGAYPDIGILLAQLDRARRAVAAGRARAAAAAVA